MSVVHPELRKNLLVPAPFESQTAVLGTNQRPQRSQPPYSASPSFLSTLFGGANNPSCPFRGTKGNLRENPANPPFKPLARAPVNTIFKVDRADDTAKVEFIWKVDSSSASVREVLGRGPPSCSLYQQRAAVMSGPRTVFNVFEAVHDEPRPRLANHDYVHDRNTPLPHLDANGSRTGYSFPIGRPQ